MTWKVDGKIDFLISNQGSGHSHWDTYRLLFQPPGSTTQEEIEKVYYLPASVCASLQNMTEVERNTEIAKWLVWKRSWKEEKQLVAGTLTVCIEYEVPNGENDTDIDLSSFAIFTADSESSTTVNAGIYHESGIVVYKSNIDNIDHNTSEKYGLTGERRYIQSISNVVLKKGLKYYIQYTNTNNNPFKPAYFSEGSGNYLNWTNGQLQGKSIADLNSVNKYLGVVSNAATWLAADENDFMISNNIGGLINTYAYIRNNLYNGASIIGQNGQTLPAAEKDKLLKLNAGDGFMYIGHNYAESSVDVLENQKVYSKNSTLDTTKYKGLKSTAKDILDELALYDYCLYNGSNTQILSTNTIYKKIESINIDTYYTTQESGQSVIDVRNIIRLSYNSNGNKYITVNGYMFWSDRTGNVYQLKSGYSWDYNRQGDTDVGFDATTLVAADMVQNRIYYVSTAGHSPAHGENWLNAGLYCWTGSDFSSSIADYDSFVAYCNVTTFADAVQQVNLNDAVTYVGVLSDLAKTVYNDNYISNNLRGETVQTGTKFYLEINGREV